VTQESEQTLLESALNGSIDSFGQLYGSYYNAMRAIAYAVLTDHHLAEDAAQETFTRALQSLERLKHKEKFGVWLGAICRNVARDMVKAQLKRSNLEGKTQQQRSSSEGSDSIAMSKAINKLSPARKELIVLRYYNQLSYEQMSAVLGLSKAAINNRLVRARKKLAHYLRRDGFGEVQI
jgi:RNA polymerase sigma-70 factor (ECF subfamily)